MIVPDESTDLTNIIPRFANSNRKISLTIKSEGKVIGWLSSFLSQDKNQHRKLVLYIDRDFRAKGIGGVAMEVIITKFAIHDLYLEVVSGNNAINLYRKFGFVECGEDKYMLKDNVHYLPVIKMVRYVSTPKVKAELQKLIKYVTTNIPELKFNTCVAEFMKFQNLIEQEGMTISIDDFLTYMKLLAPFAPFITDEIYNNLTINIASSVESVDLSETEEVSIHQTNWPTWDEKLISEEKMVIGVQVNGKLRGELELSVDDDELSLKEKVMQDMNIAKWLQGVEIKKFIYVKGRIVSIVI